jgi:sarcosine oxidase delta subunit
LRKGAAGWEKANEQGDCVEEPWEALYFIRSSQRGEERCDATLP